MRRLMGGDPELVEEAAANLAEAFASAGAEVRRCFGRVYMYVRLCGD